MPDLTTGQRIRHTRRAAGLTQRALGEKTGFSIGFLSDVERDSTTPSLKSLTRISKALGTTVAELLGEPDPDRWQDGLTDRQRCLFRWLQCVPRSEIQRPGERDTMVIRIISALMDDLEAVVGWLRA